jgi:hypothetical protein
MIASAAVVRYWTLKSPSRNIVWQVLCFAYLIQIKSLWMGRDA